MYKPTTEDLRILRRGAARDYASAAREALGREPSGERPACEGGDIARTIEYVGAITELADWILEDLIAIAGAYHLDGGELLRETAGVLADAAALLGVDDGAGH